MSVKPGETQRHALNFPLIAHPAPAAGRTDLSRADVISGGVERLADPRGGGIEAARTGYSQLQ